MAYGYIQTIAWANDYFSTERLESAIWDRLSGSGDAEKSAALLNAYNRLIYDRRFSLPTPAQASVAQLKILRIAQCEVAYYLAGHLRDEDRRKNLQAQGVIKAGIVKEEYVKEMIKEVPIPAIVLMLLNDFRRSVSFQTADLTRDENAT